MIRAITIVRRSRRSGEFDALVEFFDSLGFARGQGWKRDTGCGASFLAPVGNLEVVSGQAPAETDLLVEVSDLDGLFALMQKQERKIIKGISETHWGARLFIVEPAEEVRVAFFEFTHAAKKKRALEGELSARGRRFGIVVSRFNSFITERLLEGAHDGLRRAGAAEKDIEVVRVPGAFEIPAAARALAEKRKPDAILCLGCLLRGETPHYEHLATEVTRGIGQSAQETGVPHAFGVLTCDTLEQAIERAGLKSGNKGMEAALAAVEMANLKKAIAHAPAHGHAHARTEPRERRAKPRLSDLERIVHKVTTKHHKKHS
ncbi:MAG: 6,7-dimethyl-8-ribityllumazine synthase [Terriglobales bacterium]